MPLVSRQDEHAPAPAPPTGPSVRRHERADVAAPPSPTRIQLGGVPVDLCDEEGATQAVRDRLTGSTPRPPLAVTSVNLDHLHYFGPSGYLAGAFGIREGRTADVSWLHLIDGAPVAAQARRVTGVDWPRLSGSDLIGPLLDEAEAAGATVGFLGGSPETHALLRGVLARTRPELRTAGFWSPSRQDLLDTDGSHELAEEVAAAGTDLLVVCLGKPRQELWIDRYGASSGARVLLAFGAAVDFLAGRVTRCPAWVASHGLEWAWRLALEPRRLARRYLVNGPGAYRALRSTAATPTLAGSR